MLYFGSAAKRGVQLDARFERGRRRVFDELRDVDSSLVGGDEEVLRVALLDGAKEIVVLNAAGRRAGEDSVKEQLSEEDVGVDGAEEPLPVRVERAHEVFEIDGSDSVVYERVLEGIDRSSDEVRRRLEGVAARVPSDVCPEFVLFVRPRFAAEEDELPEGFRVRVAHAEAVVALRPAAESFAALALVEVSASMIVALVEKGLVVRMVDALEAGACSLHKRAAPAAATEAEGSVVLVSRDEVLFESLFAGAASDEMVGVHGVEDVRSQYTAWEEAVACEAADAHMFLRVKRKEAGARSDGRILGAYDGAVGAREELEPFENIFERYVGWKVEGFVSRRIVDVSSERMDDRIDPVIGARLLLGGVGRRHGCCARAKKAREQKAREQKKIKSAK